MEFSAKNPGMSSENSSEFSQLISLLLHKPIKILGIYRNKHIQISVCPRPNFHSVPNFPPLAVMVRFDLSSV